MSYDPETQYYRREGLFRFGQTFDLENIKYSYYRDPFANFLCYGLVAEAIKGFDIVNPETGVPHNSNRMFQKQIRKHLPELIWMIAKKRRDGKVLGAFMDPGNSEDPIFRGFARKDYIADYDKFGRPDKFRATSKIHRVSMTSTHEFTKTDFDSGKVREFIYKRREKVNYGMSILEPVWDILFALYMLISHSAYFVARTGAGQKELRIPESAINDAGSQATLNKLEESLTHYGAAHDVIVLPETINGTPLELNVKTVDSKQEWAELLDLYITGLVSYTGIPMSVWKGLVPGQLDAGKINEASYHDVLLDIQNEEEDTVRWYVSQLKDWYNWSLSDDYGLEYRGRDQMTRKEELTFKQQQLTIIKQYVNLGVKNEEAFKLGGMELSPDVFKNQQQGELNDRQRQPGNGQGQPGSIAGGNGTARDPRQAPTDESQSE